MSTPEADTEDQLTAVIDEIAGMSVDKGELLKEEEEEEVVEFSAIEQEAIDMGNWKRKDEFVADGGDPERWSSAHEYVKYGKIQSAMKDQAAKFDRKAREFDDRLENVNKLHQAQREADIASLKDKQRVAASEADVEAYDAHQKQIDALQEAPAAPTKDPLITEWEAKNTWIDDDDDPRAATATGAWNNFIAKNKDASVQQALAHVDSIVAKITPPVGNPRRDAAPATETTVTKTPRGSARKLTMNDLNTDERMMWAQTGDSMWSGDETKYLKACADARKGA
jgi:hypothetical protein